MRRSPVLPLLAVVGPGGGVGARARLDDELRHRRAAARTGPRGGSWCPGARAPTRRSSGCRRRRRPRPARSTSSKRLFVASGRQVERDEPEVLAPLEAGAGVGADHVPRLPGRRGLVGDRDVERRLVVVALRFDREIGGHAHEPVELHAAAVHQREQERVRTDLAVERRRPRTPPARWGPPTTSAGGARRPPSRNRSRSSGSRSSTPSKSSSTVAGDVVQLVAALDGVGAVGTVG